MQPHIDFINSLGSSDYISYMTILKDCLNRGWFDNRIEHIGFNNNSGYVYMLLENGITIASRFGQSSVFFTCDIEGNEIEHETYQDALDFLNSQYFNHG